VKITVPQPALKRAILLAAISAARPEVEFGKNISARAKVLAAALAAVLIEANDNGVFISCFDMRTSIRARVDATISEGGSFATSAAKFLALIVAFPDTATITITDTGSVTAGTSRYRLIPIAVDSMPLRFTFGGEAESVAIDMPTIGRLFEPAPAANSEESRYYMNGVNWRSVGPMLVATAACANEIIRTEIEAPTFTAAGLTVPTASVAILKKLIALARPAAITLQYNGRLLVADCVAFQLITVLVGGEKYPELSAVIPKPAAVAVCDRRELLAALQRLAAAATNVGPLLAVTFAEGAVKLFLAREPTIGADVLVAKTSGTDRFAASLPQVARMVGEIEGIETEISAHGNIRIRSPGDAGKLGVLASMIVSPAVWEHAP
jgi:DNA polymerase-3 subunit beta